MPRRALLLLAPVLAALAAWAVASATGTDDDPSAAARERLVRLLEDVPGAAGAQFGLRDDGGQSLDTLKVQPRPGGGYLGVHHTAEGGGHRVDLAVSDDLLHWRHVRTLEPDASDPTLAPAPGGGWLLAFERFEPGGASHLAVRAFASTAALLAGEGAGAIDLPRTLSDRHEGTPSIAGTGPDGVDLRFHWHDAAAGVDRNGVGTLGRGGAWKARRADALTPQAGSVGDRDHVVFDGFPFTVLEVQDRPGDWSTWHLVLYDETARTTTPLRIRTPGGSRSFANPSLTALTTPSGARGLVVTLYIHAQDGGAAPGEAGELLYVIADDGATSVGAR